MMTPLKHPAAAPAESRGIRPTRAAAVSPVPSGSLEEQRRLLKVKLLRDLVAHGLYRVSTEVLAERLIARMHEERRS